MILSKTKREMIESREHWRIPFMDFVDECRKKKEDVSRLTAIQPDNEHFDALLASAIEYVCNEAHLSPPEWVYDIPPCREPWFVAGVESLKAISIVESPVWFRRRKIFVLENFLSRI